MEILQNLNIATVGAITIICYIIGEISKAIGLNNKFVPVVVGIAGGIIGAVAFKIMPNFPAGDIINATAVGIVSGLASTGAHQVGKQLNKNE